MLELTCPEGCDNAPRKAILRGFNVAFSDAYGFPGQAKTAPIREIVSYAISLR